MNCFAHSLPFLDQPYFAIGTCLPDWLIACDRKCRIRKKSAIEFVNDADPVIAKVASGVVQHHTDDHWFHGTTVFGEMNMKFAIELREQFSNETSMRPSLIAHILIEMYLDSFLDQHNPGKLDRLYEVVEQSDPEEIQAAMNHFARNPTTKLAPEFKRFLKEKYLYDYRTNEGALYRINKVVTRLKLDKVPNDVLEWMETARERVYARAHDLLIEHQCVSQGTLKDLD